MDKKEIYEVRDILKWRSWTIHMTKVLEWNKYKDKTPAMKMVNVMRRYVSKFPNDLPIEKKIRYSYDIMKDKYKLYKKKKNR